MFRIQRLAGASPQVLRCVQHNNHTYPRQLTAKGIRNGLRRFSSSAKSEAQAQRERIAEANRRTGTYAVALVISIVGLSYAAVPLYKVFCTMTGFGGTTQRADDVKATTVKPVDGAALINVEFDSTVASGMPWKFTPTQTQVKVVPGETALAFYTVKNKSDKAITGVATYNVHPPKAGLFFNKIQCFCFEEQRLGPKEEIDMPVFFFLDPEMLKDPNLRNCRNITLSYTFFKTGEE